MQEHVRTPESLWADNSLLINTFETVPTGRLLLIHGRSPEVFELSLHAVSNAVLRGMPIVLADGSNRFDLYYVTEFARRITSQRLVARPVKPEQLLRQIFIARAFTCYQMEATITERLPLFLKKKNTTTAIIFGLLDTFYDEQAPLFQVKASLQRIIEALQKLKRDNVSVLLASLDKKVESKERNQLFTQLVSAMDQTVKLEKGNMLNGYREQLNDYSRVSSPHAQSFDN